jgi:hypothetical protein
VVCSERAGGGEEGIDDDDDDDDDADVDIGTVEDELDNESDLEAAAASLAMALFLFSCERALCCTEGDKGGSPGACRQSETLSMSVLLS